MADGRHFENSFIAISQPEIIRFQRNLVRRSSDGGESAFTYYGSSFSQCDGYDVGISQRAGASAGPQVARARRPAPACGRGRTRFVMIIMIIFPNQCDYSHLTAIFVSLCMRLDKIQSIHGCGMPLVDQCRGNATGGCQTRAYHDVLTTAAHSVE